MKYLLALLVTVFLTDVSAQSKTMCITVDDLPTVIYGQYADDFKMNLTRNLVNTFKAYDVQAIGYVHESKLYKSNELDSSEVALLSYWLDQGMDVGNQTYSHKNYHRVPFDEYAEDILQGETVTRQLLKAHQKELGYFRHPYLRIGRDQSHYDSLQNFLSAHGYTPAPVTIDNTDYLFALAYSRAYRAEDQELQERIGKDYVDYMEQKLLYYESQSMKLFGRHIAQTLLTHANLLNATYMDELLDMYQRHGYTFVSQSEVLKDPAYNEAVTRFGEYGISWIDRWALSQGKKGVFFKGDPETPEYILQITNSR